LYLMLLINKLFNTQREMRILSLDAKGGTPSNFTVKLTMLIVKVSRYFYVKTAWSCYQESCHNTLASQTTDRQTTYGNSCHCNDIAMFG